MKKKDTFEFDVAAAAKSVRAAIRLKHSIAADAEINEKLPQIEAEMADAALTGKPYQLDLSELFRS